MYDIGAIDKGALGGDVRYPIKRGLSGTSLGAEDVVGRYVDIGCV